MVRYRKLRSRVAVHNVRLRGAVEQLATEMMATKCELFLWEEPLAKHGESCPFVTFQATTDQPFFLRDSLVHLNK
jgi:hypothetical protein